MIDKATLEDLYLTYNRRRYVHPDPLEFLYEFHGEGDREIVALISSSLAYGRVAQILTNVRKVLEKMGPSPRGFLESTSAGSFPRIFSGFRHRFTGEDELARLLKGMKTVLRKYGSLNECFVAAAGGPGSDVLRGLSGFVRELDGTGSYLLPSPEKGSACKRLNLFLRWMVRKDAVDPGGWEGVSPRDLVVPLDAHMARIGRGLGLTSRATAGMKMALEISESFRAFSPEDPVKYDFVLTRLGIRAELNLDGFLERYGRSVE